MAEVWIMGEMIVEIMRDKVDSTLKDPGVFVGPYPSGAPAIFIDTVARLGYSAGIVGGVGKDDFGACLLQRLTKDGVDCSNVIKSDRFATGVAFVTYFSDGSRQFIFHMGNTPAVEPKAPDASALAGVKLFHVMGCSLLANAQFGREIVKTTHIARSLGAKVSFDPNIRKELMGDPESAALVREVLEHTNIFLPGVEELLLLTGETTVEAALEKCFGNPGMEVVVLKNGAKGCSVHTRFESFTMGVYPIEVVDTTGAGDSFDAAFVCGLLEGKSLREAAQMASAAGALNTAAFGPMEGDISPEAIRKLILRNTK